jgi:hypothetical protein
MLVMPEVSPQPSLENQPAQPQVQGGKGISWKKIIVSVVVIAVVAGIIAGGLYWFFVLNEEETTTTETTKVSTPSSKQATPSAKKDETADWKTYTDTTTGASFKYPSNWSLKKVKEYSIKATAVTSPTGFNVYFALSGGTGGACAPSDPNMKNVYVFDIKSAGFNNVKGKPVEIVEWALSGGEFSSKGANFARKEILLNNSGGWLKVGDNGTKCLPVGQVVIKDLMIDVSYKGGTIVGISFAGQYPDSSKYQQLSVKDYFNLPDVKTVEKILSSLKL